MELLKAAIAVVRGGPEKLEAIKDPFGTGPFAYRRLDKGFELKSKLVFHDQPVSLTVGQRDEVTDRIEVRPVPLQALPAMPSLEGFFHINSICSRFSPQT